MLGFVAGLGVRKVDPMKAERLRQWPDPQSIDDIISFRAYANYIREYIPDYCELIDSLKKYAKKGARFSDFLSDVSAQQAFSSLRQAVYEDAALYTANLEHASDPNSGCPFELFVDASDYAWACVLAQRQEAGRAPRPIAIYSHSFSETEQAWSAFERELFAIRESLAAVDQLIKGFRVVLYTDHKNNLLTNSSLGNRRVNKKLLRWALDIEELGGRVIKVWLKGKDNILADSVSRNPVDRDVARRLVVPGGPVKRIMRAMFQKPLELDAEIEAFGLVLESLDDKEPQPERSGLQGIGVSSTEPPATTDSKQHNRRPARQSTAQSSGTREQGRGQSREQSRGKPQLDSQLDRQSDSLGKQLDAELDPAGHKQKEGLIDEVKSFPRDSHSTLSGSGTKDENYTHEGIEDTEPTSLEISTRTPSDDMLGKE